jgi:uncharacterized BrkB/YihY/UPF0761 family membrane protein
MTSETPVGLQAQTSESAAHPCRTDGGRALWNTAWPSVRFLFQTEIHVYSFAVAANLLLSFFPFLVVMIVLCKSVFHWQAAVDVIIYSVNDYFPEGFGVNFKGYLLSAASQHNFSWISLVLLFFTANGIFEPLEVALNRIWRVKQNRSFLHNQLVGLGLVFMCGVLVLGSVSVTALNTHFLTARFSTPHTGAIYQLILFKAIAFPMTTLMIFLIYWLLPNIKIPARRLVAASVSVGILLEALKYVNILTWPWLRAKLMHEVPPFVQSTSIILWAFAGAMVILAGAEWCARATVVTCDEATGDAVALEA